MGKKENILITGLTVAGLLLSGTQATASTFQMDDLGTISLSTQDHEDGKCGEGKCGDKKDEKKKDKKKDKKADGSCGEGSCG